MALFRRGRPNVPALLRRKDVAGLIRALDDQEDASVRLSAAGALGQLGPAAVEPLLAAIEATPRLRGHAALALGAIADPRAVERMIALLGDPVAEVRFLAALALGRMGDSRAVDPLLAALDDPERDVREASARALGDLRDERAVIPLTALLADPDEGVREQAARALDGIGAGPRDG